MDTQRIVDHWNRSHPIGTAVALRLDTGQSIETYTRSAAQLLADHTPVIWLKGRVGAYLLSRCTPIAGRPPLPPPET